MQYGKTNLGSNMKDGVSVVVQSVGREYLLGCLNSINSQTYKNNIQILVGLDANIFGKFNSVITEFEKVKNKNVELTVIDLGYSTSERHGGVYPNRFGGSLRSALTLLSRYQHVAYLDDDDWASPDHIEELKRAIYGKFWAYTLSNYASENGIIGPDTQESVGPSGGLFDGFVRPSALMIDKLVLLDQICNWTKCNKSGDGEDRMFFNSIREFPHGATGKYTVNCIIDPADVFHLVRMQSGNVPPSAVTKRDSVRRKK